MPRKNRIQVLTVKCKRGCGSSVTTTSRSIHGFDDLHRKYNGICKHCLTAEEEQEINESMFSPEGAANVLNSLKR